MKLTNILKLMEMRECHRIMNSFRQKNDYIHSLPDIYLNISGIRVLKTLIQ